MARARKQQADSLELLLDTICNTFGGVVFIAILVVILLQAAGDQHPTEEKVETEVSAEELADLTHRLTAVTTALDSLRAAQESQDALMARLAPEESQSLVRSRNESREDRHELEVAREQLIATIAERQTTIQVVKSELSAINTEQQAAKSRLSELQEQINRERDARREDIRLPVVHSNARLRRLGVILRYGRLYVWHRYDKRGNRLGLNTDEFVILEENESGYITTPKPNAGIPLMENAETRRRILQRLSHFPSGQTAVEVVVRPDSYTHFQHFRDILREKGYDYRLMPMDNDVPVIDRGGSSVGVQ